MTPNQKLMPVDPAGTPIELTSEQVAELERRWAETFTADFNLRIPEEMRLTEQEQKTRLLARIASLTAAKG